MALRVVRSEGEDVDRVAVAAAHIENAIAHLNNVAQGVVPPAAFEMGALSRVEELRLIVRALADIRESLRTVHRERVEKS